MMSVSACQPGHATTQATRRRALALLALGFLCATTASAAAVQARTLNSHSFYITVQNCSSYTVTVKARPSVGATKTIRLAPGSTWRPQLTTTSSTTWAQVVATYGTCKAARQGRYSVFTIANAKRGCQIEMTRK